VCHRQERNRRHRVRSIATYADTDRHWAEPPLSRFTVQCSPDPYTNSVAIYHYFALGLEGVDCGVFGDGDNAAYEWFAWRESLMPPGAFGNSYSCHSVQTALVPSGNYGLAFLAAENLATHLG
jgi:hypothetical protein